MANYISDVQSRSAFPDKNVLMCSYVKMNIPQGNAKENMAKKSELEMMSALAAKNVHRSVEMEISIRKGSVIAEIIASGHITELLTVENLQAIGMSITKEDLVDGLISYVAIRCALLILVKDIKLATASLSMMTRWVYGAQLGDIQRAESRTGIAGNLLRLLEAFDVARAKKIAFSKRNSAIKRALFQLEKIEEVTNSAEDREILSRYVKRELKRVNKISLSKAEMEEEDTENVAEYNARLKSIANLADKL